MPSETHLRQATLQDVEAVSSILKEAALWLEQEGMPLWGELELEPAAIDVDVRAGLFFLAEQSGTPAGTVKFQLEDLVFWPEAHPHEAAYVHRLAVRRIYAGTGLSTKILRWAAGRAQVFGFSYLRLDCVAGRPRLRAVYERFGFEHHSDKHVGPYFVSRYQYNVTKQ